MHRTPQVRSLAFGAISFLVVAAPHGRAADSHRSVMALPAINQQGSPIQIVQIRSTNDNFFDTVVVKNTSDKAISAIQFGVMYSPSPDKSSLKPLLYKGESLWKTIYLNEQKELSLSMEPPTAILARTKSWGADVIAEIGVLDVTFDTGERFTFDPERSNGFSSKPIASSSGIKACTQNPRGIAVSVIALSQAGQPHIPQPAQMRSESNRW